MTRRRIAVTLMSSVLVGIFVDAPAAAAARSTATRASSHRRLGRRNPTAHRFRVGLSYRHRLPAVLATPGVTAVLITYLINDIRAPPHVSDPALIENGLRDITALAHQRGVAMIATTITAGGGREPADPASLVDLFTGQSTVGRDVNPRTTLAGWPARPRP